MIFSCRKHRAKTKTNHLDSGIDNPDMIADDVLTKTEIDHKHLQTNAEKNDQQWVFN